MALKTVGDTFISHGRGGQEVTMLSLWVRENQQRGLLFNLITLVLSHLI